MIKTKKEIVVVSKEYWNTQPYDTDAFVVGYTLAQKNMMKYKKAFEILNCYFDSISDEEQLKVAKQLEKLGVW